MHSVKKPVIYKIKLIHLRHNRLLKYRIDDFAAKSQVFLISAGANRCVCKTRDSFFFLSLCISQSLNQFAFYSYIHPFFVVHTTCPLSAWSCLGHNLVAFSPCVPPVPRSRFVRWFCSFSACLFHISSICWEKGEPRWFLLWMGNTFLSIWKDFQN